MTKRLSESEKQQRRPTSRACVNCHIKHLQCSHERPCSSCVKRGVATECRDIERKKNKYLGGDHKRQRLAPASSSSSSSSSTSSLKQGPMDCAINTPVSSPNLQVVPIPKHLTDQLVPVKSSPASIIEPATPLIDTNAQAEKGGNLLRGSLLSRFSSTTMFNTTDDVLERLFGDDDYSHAARTPDSQQGLSEEYPLALKSLFSSTYLSQEYNVLGEIVQNSKPVSPTPSNSSLVDAMNQSSGQLTFTPPTLIPTTASPLENSQHSTSQAPALETPQYSSSRAFPTTLDPNQHVPHLPKQSVSSWKQRRNKAQQSRPFISLGTEATSSEDQMCSTPTENLHLAVQHIYSGAPASFDFPESYHSLTKFLKTRFLGQGLSAELRQQKHKSLIEILKLIASYRPTFISAHKLLSKPTDLRFLEMSLQRSLLDYQGLCYLNPSPTIIWRRTGEIVSVTNDLLSILGYDLKDLVGERTFIVELMHDDESIINYYRLFKSVAVGNLHLTIFTQCKLTKKTGSCGSHFRDFIDFCSVWTVKRDLFDLPMLIIGQFLPVLHGR